MKIFVDTADIDEIREAISWGIVDGVTTNPSLIKKAVQKHALKDMNEYIKEILRAAGKNCSVSLEVTALDEQGMFDQAVKLYEKFNPVAGNVAVKIPIVSVPEDGTGLYDGLKVTKRLAEKGIPVNSTLIMTPEQALLAAKAGARFVSPFAGRIDDFLDKGNPSRKKDDYYPFAGKDGKHDNGIASGADLVEKIVCILKIHGHKTEVISASLRNTRQVREVALSGSHIATIPFSVLKEMLKHSKTFEGVKKFSEDVVPEYSEVFG